MKTYQDLQIHKGGTPETGLIYFNEVIFAENDEEMCKIARQKGGEYTMFYSKSKKERIYPNRLK